VSSSPRRRPVTPDRHCDKDSGKHHQTSGFSAPQTVCNVRHVFGLGSTPTELHSAAASYSDHIANLTAEAWRGQGASSLAGMG
jgi:hypothetical protein